MAELDQDDLPSAVLDRRLLARLLGYLKPHWPLVALSGGLLLIHAGLAVVGPALTQRALDRAVPAGDVGLLNRYALFFLATMSATFVVDYAQAIITTRIGQRVMFDLRMAIFRHLERLSVPYFDRHPVGRLMTRVTSDVETLNELFSSGVISGLGDLFTLIAIAAMMLAIDARLAVVALLGLPAMALVVSIFRRHIREAFRVIRARVARLNSFLQEHLSGVEVVRLFGRQAAAEREFAAVNQSHLDAHLRSITIYAIFFPLVELVVAVAMALLLVQGGAWIAGGTLSVGVLAAFIQLVRRFFQPLQDLSEKVNLLQSAMASSERVFRLLDAPVTVADPETPAPLSAPVRGEVAFENVWFRYAADGPWVLQDLSFRVPAGGTVALVGHTGAGKTTVISLLLRFYDPERGRITLDGVDIRDVALADLRRQFGFVQQDLFLFTGDILRNLALDAETSEMRVRLAADRVGVGPFIERLPGGYGHVLTERGKNLSVGERQLLSFARALARDPRILLLDEATSSVDSEAEARIQRGVDELMAGRTAIVVAHRLSTILHAGEILVMHHGRIVERGAHHALLTRRGVYERLYRLQIGTRPVNSC
ncbi:MAG: ABC transporter ATP-binding protein [Gemmatimonadales bacterium]